MKLQCLIHPTLVLILASYSKGQSWNISVNSSITAPAGSNVTIRCTFTVPQKHDTENVQVYWKKPGIPIHQAFDKDHNPFVFHPNDSVVLEKYRGKTKLIKAKGKDCSLVIFNIQDNEPNIYMRVIAKGQNYSFTKNPVSIFVFASGETPVRFKPDIIQDPLPTGQTTSFSTVNMNQMTSSSMYMTIFFPFAALLVIAFIVGLVFYTKYKRTQSFIREDSGYYANFSRANQRNKTASLTGASSKKQEKNFPEMKVIDAPVYMNFEAPLDEMDPSTVHTDDIYANIDYSK